MSNKVTIKSKHYIETSMEVTLPAYFQEKRGCHYIAIITPTKQITISDYDFSRSVQCTSIFDADIQDENYKQITADEFYKAYNKCLQDITKEVATATAYDEQKLSITGS